MADYTNRHVDHKRFQFDATCPECVETVRGPAEPASVRVGDVVEIEADDGSWMVRARVADTDDPSHDGPPYPQDSPFGIKLDRFYWWPKIAGATVRVLHAAEPEPDPGVVQALIEAMEEADRSLGEREKEDWPALARALIRDHGVRVGVSE